MNCGESKELLQLYLDSELDARNTLEMQRHLESCPACVSLLNQFSRMDHALREVARSETSDNSQMRKEILTAIRKHPPETGKRWRPHPVLRRVAAVALVAIAAALLLLRGDSGLSDKVYADAASDHAAHCTLDKLTRAVSDPAEMDQLVAAYGQLQKMPDLSAFGYSEPRAKVCSLDGARALHIVYQGQGKQPLSLFLRPVAAQSVAERLGIARKDGYQMKDGYQVASVSKAGVDLLVVSSIEEQQIQAIAQSVAAQM
ncbi:MAG TPA: anti-sigma factor [Blastocatellia bacterium]|nr:anti-sigma factor [Blastocatellia bacterium]